MRSVYSPIAITLHWILAVLLISMVFFGWYMEGLRESMLAGENVPLSDVQFAYNAHKTTGLFVLALSLFRLGWRLTHPAPALPEGMKPYEAWIAKATHWGFYALMIGLPLGGWAATVPAPPKAQSSAAGRASLLRVGWPRCRCGEGSAGVGTGDARPSS